MRLLLVIAGLLLVAPLAEAQQCSSSSNFLASAMTWQPPLDRRASLHARDISLREALDRVSSAARVRLSYTTEALPLDTRVCASFDSLSLGQALTMLVQGMGVIPTAAGGENVVLRPAQPFAGEDATEKTPRILDRVVVTGSAIEAPARRLTVAMNVVTGAQLARYSQGNLAEALNDAVPGVWVWQTSPTALLARYGSIRGTSSFGASYPKIYLDGIELANPEILTQIPPETVERVEITKGPQGAALYGTDAISGVINVVMRHDGSNGGAKTIARTAFGSASSAYVPRSAVTQDHAITIREGSGAQSGSVSFASGGVGSYLPGAFARQTTASAALRIVNPRLIASGTARVFASSSKDPASPLYRDSVNATRLGLTIPQSTREYTLGGNATFIQSDQWTHIVVAGLDVSSISNVSDFSTPLPSATAASVGRAGGKAGLTTLKGSSVGRFGDADGVETTVTLSGENTFLDLEPASNTTAGFTAQTQPVQRLTTSGIAQANVAWRETGYLTGGLRLERNDALDNSSISLLPMLGAAAVRDFGALTVKLRSAYGRGIRPVSTPAREMEWFDPRHEARFTSLAPESQSGIEAGMDAFLGKFIGLQITRFDQRASGLVQRVAYAFSGDFSHEGPGGGSSGEGSGRVAPEDRHIDYALQNVGEITNRGWELKGDANIAALTLSGTLATVDSRVRKLAYGYTGDLKVGDRMLDVPAKTATASAIWTAPRWMASVSAARSWDWISYDRIALAGAFTNSTQTDAQLVGAQLRSYWLQYSGVTRLRASLGFSLSRALSLSVSGDNLLNYQFGEPDNVTVVPGRTISFGLRTNL